MFPKGLKKGESEGLLLPLSKGESEGDCITEESDNVNVLQSPPDLPLLGGGNTRTCSSLEIDAITLYISPSWKGGVEGD